MGNARRHGGLQLLGLLALCSGSLAAQDSAEVSARSSDGVVVYGQTYFGSLDDSAPLILLFHQGGSNGRGEYAELVPFLNVAGFRAVAWDLRAGGDIYGGQNRTAAGLRPDTPREFCDAYPDLQAALNFVTSSNLASQIVLMGSSYSAALIFQLAAEQPAGVSALVGFSPASSGPMADCRARSWIDEVAAPIAVFRPDSEMTRESSVEQRQVLTEAGAEFFVVEHGVHGSSMLLDSRTGQDMGQARRLVIDWLRQALNGPDSAR